MPEISIMTADGVTKNIPLEGQSVGLGRAGTNELCFPDDGGLSRNHLVFEPQGDGWRVRDCGSKNGTLVNGRQIKEVRLKAGDCIRAGHLTIQYEPAGRSSQHRVVFVDSRDETRTKLTTVSTHLSDGETSVAAGRIGALLRAGRELAGHRPLSELFPLILNLAIEAVQAERGILLTVEDGELAVQASSAGDFRISSGVRDRVLKEKTSILVNDVQSNAAYRGMQSLLAQQVQMLMAVPLQTNYKVIGLIYVDSPTLVREFTKDDLNLLTVMANIAAIRIEHARLVEVEQAEKILANDLEQAAIIQRQLLPAKAPAVPGLSLAGYNCACRTVGGDYFDFLTYPDGRVALALGDVSGKAMPAALLMTSLQARVQVLAEQPPDVADLLIRLNRITTANCPEGRFVSFFFCLIDPVNGDFSYANAGHNLPLMVRASGEVERLNGSGLLLGILPDVTYEAYRGRIRSGDVLLIYSDGVTEAANPAGEWFEDARLIDVVKRSRDGSAEDIVRAVNDAVLEFAAGAPSADDLTLVAVKSVV